jgi:hypothetical protein
MDYAPFQSTNVFTAVMSVLIIATFICLMPALVLSFVGSKRVQKISSILFLIGIPLALLAIGLMVYGLFANLTPDARKDAYLRDAATSLSETYGIEVTEQNIKEMDYPTDEQNERRYFGTTAVKTGPAVNDFITARLAYDDGKVYLLKQVGEDYEELEPVR